MKKVHLPIPIILIILFSFSIGLNAQHNPRTSFNDLILNAEQDFSYVIQARELADKNGHPHTIYMKDGIFIEAKAIEDGKVVYTIINNLDDIYNNGEVAYFDEIYQRYDLEKARLHYLSLPTQNAYLGFNTTNSTNGLAASLVLVPESTTDAVMAFDALTGDLVTMTFVPSDPTNLSTPIEALLTSAATLLVSDQITDKITEYDTTGAFIRVLFGGDVAILDNCRGIEERPGTNSVVATIGSGTNQDAIPEFDLTTGAYLGNFIAPNATVMDSPFDIIFRATDCLVTASTSNDVTRYDLSGNYLDDFVASIAFPEQIHETSTGDIIVAGFSTPSGLYVYDLNGVQKSFFGGVTGLRGAYKLGSGNYLITNGSGVFIIDGNTGATLSQPAAGVSARFAREYDLSIIPVELTSFAASALDGSVALNWSTATETNNSGFEIERNVISNEVRNLSWERIGFVQGAGTTTEPRLYSFIDNSVSFSTAYYRLKQIDFDGSFTYSKSVQVDVGTPDIYSLEQNYPNPFNPSTLIKYQIPVNGFVTIKVFDVIGNEVAVLVSESKQAGKHSVEFDANNLSGGVYLYQITSDNFVSTRKMVLLK